MMTTHFRFALLAAGCMFASGCIFQHDEPSFGHLDIADVSYAPAKADLEPNHVTVAEGIAVKAHVSAVDSQGTVYEPLHLTSMDPQIVAVDPGPTAGSWVFSGVAVGKTSIRVSGGGPLGSVGVEVVPQSGQ
jgi:hypothetical protein